MKLEESSGESEQPNRRDSSSQGLHHVQRNSLLVMKLSCVSTLPSSIFTLENMSERIGQLARLLSNASVEKEGARKRKHGQERDLEEIEAVQGEEIFKDFMYLREKL